MGSPGTQPPRPDGPRSGAARLPLLGLALVAAVLVAALALWMRTAGVPTAPRAARPEVAPRGAPSPGEPLEDASNDDAPDEARAAIELSDPTPLPEPADAYSGRGRIRGRVEEAGGARLPERFRVVLAPAVGIRGAEPAERRVLDLYGDEREFEAADLPLGAYEITVQAPGIHTVAARVLLRKPVTDQYVTLRASAAGFVQGRVVDERGTAVADVPVVLEAVPSGERRATSTDAGGGYLFDDVADGLYRVLVRDPERSLATPREIVFRAPSLTVPPLETPLLGSLVLSVRDEADRPVEGAAVRGWGEGGGTVDVTTDASGEATARFLPGGGYKLLASHPDAGRARAACQVEPGERVTVAIALSR